MNWMDLMTVLMDERTILETAAVAIGSSFSALFYYIYKRQESKARKIDDAPLFEITNELSTIVREAPFSYLPYVAINGRVSSVQDCLTSQANDQIKGVVWKKNIKEHKEVWYKYSQTWQSSDREISSYSNSLPFGLSGKDGNAFIHVIDPFESEWFDDTIDVVHEHFTPTSSTMVESIVGYVSGDRLRGFTDTESMLRLGTKLCAIGELVYEDRVLKIKPPSSEVGDYIISNYTQKEIVSQIRGKAKLFKVFGLLIGAASITAVYFVIRRLITRYKEMKQEQQTREELNEIRQQRTAISGRLNRSNTDNDEEDACVICLTNPRECVLLDCGHICVCVDCLEALPSPKECPVCRSRVARTVALFHA